MAIQFYDPVRNQTFVMPYPMRERGRYHFDRRPELGQNGRGDVIEAQYAKATWQWTRLPLSDWEWWISTLLPGMASLRCTGATRIWTHLMTETFSVSHLIVKRPSYSYTANGYFHDVKVEFTHIIL